MSYAEYAPAYMAAGFQPIPVEGKHRIPKGCTGVGGTVTPEKVTGWVADKTWMDENLALRLNSDQVVIDVDHYAGKTGGDDLSALEKQLGALPKTPYSTARGGESPSRQMWFRVPEGFRSVSSLSDSIEVLQHDHRFAIVYPSFHVDLGSQYVWYDANGSEMWGFPTPDDFAVLPDSWLEYMKADQRTEHTGFGGTVDDWLDNLATGEPTEAVKRLIDTLPLDDFNHQTVIGKLWQLTRLGAEGHSGIRWALESIEDAWVKPPYDTASYVRELELAIEGAIAKGGAPEWPEPLEKSVLLPLIEKYDDLEEWVWGSKPKNDQNRAKLIKYLYSLKLSRHEILSFVWHSNQNVAEHPAELWAEVQALELLPSGGATETVVLLTDTERERVKVTPNFIDQYQAVAKLREENPNLPYHRGNALTFLSVLFGATGHLPKRGSFGGVGLNLYIIEAGDTTSGKGEAKNQLLAGFRYALGDDFDDIDIGGDPSPEALHKKMIERDGEVTWFNLDEGDQLLSRLVEKGNYSSGLQQKLTDWFEGRVGARLRLSDTESAKNAKAYLVLWLMGTPTAIMANLLPKQVESGFLARFVTYFGNPRHITAGSLETEEQDEDEIVLGYDPYIRQLGMEQAAIKRSFRVGADTVAVRQTKEAKSRLSEARRQMFVPYADHKLADLIEPALVRLGINMWKVAGLIAMSRGSAVIELEDALIAVQQAEEWLPNLVRLMEGVVASDWTQEVERVFEWVQQHGSVSKAQTYRRFNAKTDFELDNITRSLMNQKRIKSNEKEGTWETIE